MRKSVFVLILISMATASWAQKKKKNEKQEPAKEVTPAQARSKAGQKQRGYDTKRLSAFTIQPCHQALCDQVFSSVAME